MKIFIGSAIIKEIEWAEERGLIDGVSTNPSFLSKADRKLSEVVNDIFKLIKDRPVGIEAVSQEIDDIIEEARGISKIAKNVVVKIPLTDQGLIAIRKLAEKGIKTDATLVFTPAQALLAARAGATFVSIFVGGLNDAGNKGMEVVKEVVRIFQNYDMPTMVRASAIRNVREVEEAALAGADAATVPFKVLVQMFRHDLTDAGIRKYQTDWEKVPK